MRQEIFNAWLWQRWFAWYPIMAKGKNGEIAWVWLENVHRRLETNYAGGWEYLLIKE